MQKSLFRRWFGLARIYWRDAKSSSLDYVSQRRCYLAAAERVGVSQQTAIALFDSGLDESITANAHLYALNERIDFR